MSGVLGDKHHTSSLQDVLQIIDAAMEILKDAHVGNSTDSAPEIYNDDGAGSQK
jgi:hypothetical protein